MLKIYAEVEKYNSLLFLSGASSESGCSNHVVQPEYLHRKDLEISKKQIPFSWKGQASSLTETVLDDLPHPGLSIGNWT